MPPTALRDFFTSFPQFRYKREERANLQWKRLCRVMEWPAIWDEEEHEERDEARQRFQRASTMQFNQIYGTEENNLANWQALCRRIGFRHIPDELVAARDAVLLAHVNLSDLVDNYDNDEPILQFRTLEELRIYTRENNLYFPKEDAYAGGLLKYLLRELIGEYNGHRRPSNQAKGRRGENRRGRGARGGKKV